MALVRPQRWRHIKPTIARIGRYLSWVICFSDIYLIETNFSSKDIDEDNAAALSTGTEKGSALTGSPTGASASASTTGGEPSSKALKTGKQYACTQCSYSADKKVSLNRHMRMHQSSPAPSSSASNGAGGGMDESTTSQVS